MVMFYVKDKVFEAKDGYEVAGMLKDKIGNEEGFFEFGMLKVEPYSKCPRYKLRYGQQAKVSFCRLVKSYTFLQIELNFKVKVYRGEERITLKCLVGVCSLLL